MILNHFKLPVTADARSFAKKVDVWSEEQGKNEDGIEVRTGSKLVLKKHNHPTSELLRPLPKLPPNR